MKKYNRLQVIKLVNDKQRRMREVGGDADERRSRAPFDAILSAQRAISNSEIDSVLNHCLSLLPTIKDQIPEVAAGGDFREYLKRQARGLNSGVKVALQMFMTYCYRLTKLDDREKLDNIKSGFLDVLRQEGSYNACLDGFKIKLMNSMTKLDAGADISYSDDLVMTAHDRVINKYSMSLRAGDVHLQEVLRYAVGENNDETAAYNSSAFNNEHLCSFENKWKLYREYNKRLQEEVNKATDNEIDELVSFVKRRPIKEGEADCAYDLEGKLFLKDGLHHYIRKEDGKRCKKYDERSRLRYSDGVGKACFIEVKQTEAGYKIAGRDVTCTKSAGENQYSVTLDDGRVVTGEISGKTTLPAGYYVDGEDKSLASVLYDARDILGEELKAKSLIAQHEDLDMHDWANLVDEYFAFYLPDDVLKRELRRMFFPPVFIEPESVVVGDGDKSFTEVVKALGFRKPTDWDQGVRDKIPDEAESAMFAAFKSDDIGEKISAFNALYMCYGKMNRDGRAFQNYRKLVFDLGITLLSESEVREHAANGRFLIEHRILRSNIYNPSRA